MYLHPGPRPHDYYDALPEQPDEEEFEEDPEGEDHFSQQEWREVAAQLPQHDPDTEEVELPGNRDIDQAHDWSDNIGKFPRLTSQKIEYWKNIKASFSQPADDAIVEQAVASLNPEQRLVYDIFTDHLAASLDPNRDTPQPLLCQVDGQGGTGKSFLIQTPSAALKNRAAESVVRAAPTGITANTINETTLHSLLRLPVSRQVSTLPALSGNELTSLQASMAAVKYLIIEGKSMIGLKTLHAIDVRLRKIFPETKHEFFGDRSVLLLGDFYQSPPVVEKPLFAAGNLDNTFDVAGQNAYRQFDHTVELKQVVQQQGEDQALFRQALQGLRSGKPALTDWQLLCTRIQSQLGRHEVISFNEAVRIYPTTQQVRDYNRHHMELLNRPVILINPTHGSKYGNDADSEAAGNLHKTLPICLGARVMLTENIWTSVGLGSGAMGIVEDIAWEERPEGVDTSR
ncbi:hypothetical protein FSARC_14162 [Fusarium sarcochroum]|uniref:ATP-dependent DNA helicase n=1 Tax=Fusarium sarcochroum TaxID=1208366 RepID=A0A8H4SW18_9HYPO|nr:hypothetical protein FSARC_14162 [Fusarium sarcochroum]